MLNLPSAPKKMSGLCQRYSLRPPPELTNGDVTIYSASRLNTYLQCPRWYFLSYIERIESKSASIAADIGSLAHEICEHFYDEIPFPTPTPEIDFERTLTELYFKYKDNYLPLEEQKDKDKLFVSLKNFLAYEVNRYQDYEKRGILDDWKPNLVETKMYGTIEGKKFVGIIDKAHFLCDSQNKIYDIIPVDYKTGGIGNYSLQMNIYAELLRQNFGVYPTAFYIHYITQDRMKKMIIDEDSLKEMKKTALDVINRIENHEFYVKTAGWHCQWCDFSPECSTIDYQNQGLIDF